MAKSKTRGKNAVVYEGILAEKIPPVGLLAAALKSKDGQISKKDSDRFWDWVFNSRILKMKELFAFYNIDPATDAFAGSKLAFALACQHVPGFQVGDTPRRGAPKKHDWRIEIEINHYVEQGLSFRKACIEVSKQHGCKTTAERRKFYERQKKRKMNRE